MNISTTNLRQYVIEPTLHYLGMHSLAAIHMLEGVANHESSCDPFSAEHQGLGIYQITTLQHRLIWDKYLAFQPDLASQVRGLASQHQFLKDPDSELITNLRYSTAIAWMLFLHNESSEVPMSEPISPYWHKLYVEEDGSENSELPTPIAVAI